MKKAIFGIGAIILVAAVYGIYQYYKPHKNIKTAKEDIEVTAPNLYAEYTEHEGKANEKYLNKLILISGVIAYISVDNSENVNIYLNVGTEGIGSVSCNFNPSDGAKALNYSVGNQVKIKGICAGYAMDVVLNKCVIVE